MSDFQIIKVDCPSCGAPLLFSPGENSTRCQFCAAIIERPVGPGRSPIIRFGPSTPPRMQPTLDSIPDFRPSTLKSLIILLSLVAIIGLCLFIGFFLASLISASKLALPLNGPTSLLPMTRMESPGWIALVYGIPVSKAALRSP